jgi:16S rRNA (cytidine1402-2'-O)-methyltransferase
VKEEAATLIFYETPHRIVEALGDIERVLGERPVVVARELTKVHEEFLRGTAGAIRTALAARPSVKGEITLLIGKGMAPTAETTSIEDAVDMYVRGGMGRMEAMKKVARERRISKRDVYRRTQIEKR